MYINRDINEARIRLLDCVPFRVNPKKRVIVPNLYQFTGFFHVLFEVLVDGIYLFNDECHFVF